MKKIWIFFCFAGSYCQKWLFCSLGMMVSIQSVFFGFGLSTHGLPFDQTINPLCIQLSFIAVLWILSFRMTQMGCGKKGPTYFIQRIDTSAYQITLGFFAYALVTFFLLWAVQVSLLWIFSWIYGAVNPTLIGPQTLFLLTNNVEFFHFLLPTLDTTLLVFSIATWLILSLAYALGWKKRFLPTSAQICVLALISTREIGMFGIITTAS